MSGPRHALADLSGAHTPGYRRMSLANARLIEGALRHRHSGGSTSIERLAVEMGVSRRTLYRWRGCRFEDVTVDGWVATFVTRPDHLGGVPVQVTPWLETLP